jgi:hypothetical protein
LAEKNCKEKKIVSRKRSLFKQIHSSNTFQVETGSIRYRFRSEADLQKKQIPAGTGSQQKQIQTDFQ